MVVSRRWGWFLIGFALWNLWVWATFVWNVYPQHHFDAFFIVHALIGGATTALGFAVGSVGVRIVRA